jgi:hypothetical protein
LFSAEVSSSELLNSSLHSRLARGFWDRPLDALVSSPARRGRKRLRGLGPLVQAGAFFVYGMAALTSLVLFMLLGSLWIPAEGQAVTTYSQSMGPKHQNAYATILYTGTVRDYEFFIATRVMLK